MISVGTVAVNSKTLRLVWHVEFWYDNILESYRFRDRAIYIYIYIYVYIYIYTFVQHNPLSFFAEIVVLQLLRPVNKVF